MGKKYKIEWLDNNNKLHSFTDDKPYNFIIYNPSDGVLVNARELNYGQRGWLIPDEFGCEFTKARVCEIDDRLWNWTWSDDYKNVLDYKGREVWHDDTIYNPAVLKALEWIIEHQPDVLDSFIDEWITRDSPFLNDKHLLAIQLLYSEE